MNILEITEKNLKLKEFLQLFIKYNTLIPSSSCLSILAASLSVNFLFLHVLEIDTKCKLSLTKTKKHN